MKQPMVNSDGWVVWLTGLPASGKSSLASALSDILVEHGLRAQILDSDQLRHVLTPEPTYTQSERDWFYQVIGYIAHLLSCNGVNVIIAATANRRLHRDRAREIIEKLMIVYVRCSLETCIARDPKGIYTAAKQGEAQTVPGIQSPYDVPENPEVVVDSEHLSPQEGAQLIFERIQALYY